MDKSLNINGLIKKTERLEYEDGLRDFQIGAIFLILGLASWSIFTPAGLEFLVRTVIRYQDLLLPAFGGSIGLFILLVIGGERVMERIRRATFWRESGFVKPLRFGAVNQAVMILAGIVALGVIIGSVWLMMRGTVSQEIALRSIPASAGLATAITYIGLGRNLQIRRYVLVGVTGAILSGVILITDMAFALAYLWFGIGWAVMFSISGLWALGSALRDLRQGAQNG